ncbi:unnamed protein product [Bathycoccus prasinos]
MRTTTARTTPLPQKESARWKRRHRRRRCALNPAGACENTFHTSSSFVVDFDFPPFVGVALDTKERVARMLEATISSAYLADEVDKEEDKERLRGMVEKKEDGTPVTAADFAIQTLMENVLGGDGEEVVGEERRPVEGDASFDRVKELVEKFTPCGRMVSLEKERCGPGRNYFVLDPIDGTKAFAAKPTIRSRAYAFTEQYCIGLSYHDGETGEVLAACVAAPRWERGSGERVLLEGAVHPGVEMEAMLFDVPFVYDSVAVSESDVGKATTLNSGWKVPKSNLDEIPYGSGSLIKYVAIAVNACDAFVHYKPWTFSMNVWDHAAGVLCCEEAGAIVSDGFGNRLSLKRKPRKTEGDFEERDDVDPRRVFSPQGKAVVVANEESLHKEILRAHNSGVKQINEF